MLNENARRWVNALRSGSYEQGTGFLAKTSEDNTMQFCCLGVACELFVKENPGMLGVTDRESFRQYGTDAEVLPEPVQKWLGLKGHAGQFGNSEFNTSSLSHLNDMHVSFNAIAEIIEAEPSGLFN